jgi:hypothetical protein
LPEELAGRRWRNLLDASGERLSGDLRIADLLARFPVALLCATSDDR